MRGQGTSRVTSRRAASEDPDALFQFLQAEMRTRDWNVSRLAEACDVDVALASRWVAGNGKRRVWPGPRSCEKIADALDVDPDVVVVLAGHRRPRSARAVIDAKRQVAQGDSVVRLRQLGNSDVGLC